MVFIFIDKNCRLSDFIKNGHVCGSQFLKLRLQEHDISTHSVCVCEPAAPKQAEGPMWHAEQV